MEALNGTLPFADAPAPGTDPEALRTALERDGYLCIRGLIAPERVMALRRLALEHARTVAWLDPAAPVEDGRARPGLRIGDYQEPKWMDLQARVQTSEELWDVGDTPAVHGLLTAACGHSSFLYVGMNTCRIVSPHPEVAARPHQDRHYVPVDGSFVTVWVPLGDCPIELGPLAVLPGSHRRGLLPHRGFGIIDGGLDVEDDDAVWHSGAFASGDVLVLTQHVIHRALPNLSGDRLRVSVDLRYGFRPNHAE